LAEILSAVVLGQDGACGVARSVGIIENSSRLCGQGLEAVSSSAAPGAENQLSGVVFGASG
jgi:hypothetical protein